MISSAKICKQICAHLGLTEMHYFVVVVVTTRYFVNQTTRKKRITVNISLKGQVTPSDVQCFPYCKQRDTF